MDITNATEVRRMWINQPSTLQPHHDRHGEWVLAVREYKGTERVYFLSGPTISMQMLSHCLSEGWPTRPQSGPCR